MFIAGPFGFKAEEFFDAEPEAAQVPKVDLTLRHSARGRRPAPGSRLTPADVFRSPADQAAGTET